MTKRFIESFVESTPLRDALQTNNSGSMNYDPEKHRRSVRLPGYD